MAGLTWVWLRVHEAEWQLCGHFTREDRSTDGENTRPHTREHTHTQNCKSHSKVPCLWGLGSKLKDNSLEITRKTEQRSGSGQSRNSQHIPWNVVQKLRWGTADCGYF